MKFLFRLLFKMKGWKANLKLPEGVNKSVVIAAPHTSNWDMIFLIAGMDLINIPLRFTIKKSWMKFPLSLLTKPLGGISINRTPKKEGEERPSMVDAMAELFKGRDRLALAVTPEGTRALRKQWKTGFYHIAKQAGVPICLGYLDYEKKEAGIGKTVWLSDDFEADMKQIMDYYKDGKAKFPEKFSVDISYI